MKNISRLRGKNQAIKYTNGIRGQNGIIFYLALLSNVTISI
jgi:hypothetical protein